MAWTDLLLRYAHVLLGALWMSLAFMVVLVLGPSLLALGPAERKPLQLQLLPRQIAFAALASVGTLLSGLALMHQVYLGPTGLGFASDRGKWLLAGALLGLAAFGMAVGAVLPTAKRMLAALQGDGDPSQLPALGAKMAKLGRAVMMHLVESLMFMLLAAHPLLPFSWGNLIGALLLGTAFGYGLVLLSAKFAPQA